MITGQARDYKGTPAPHSRAEPVIKREFGGGRSATLARDQGQPVNPMRLTVMIFGVLVDAVTRRKKETWPTRGQVDKC